ncbi:Alpha beta-hydrolase, partial [Rhizoctonia solani]
GKKSAPRRRPVKITRTFTGYRSDKDYALPQRRTLERGQQYSHPSSYASDMDFQHTFYSASYHKETTGRSRPWVRIPFKAGSGEEDKTTPFSASQTLSTLHHHRWSAFSLSYSARRRGLSPFAQPTRPARPLLPTCGTAVDRAFISGRAHVRTPGSRAPKRATTISFANPKAAQYLVDGTKIPEVDFDVVHPGRVRPIDADLWERKRDEKAVLLVLAYDEPGVHGRSCVWTNGGPGCSSLEGLLQENGPFTWPTGTAKPIRNQWAWTNLVISCPLGRATGRYGILARYPNITNEDQLAAQFAGFLAQFLEVFSELKGKNFYATGESYAGVYVPYIANYLYEHPKAVDLKLKGTWITDPAVSYDLKWKDVLGLNSSFVSYIQQVGDKCGFTDYSKKYATYPPAGPTPAPSHVVRRLQIGRALKTNALPGAWYTTLQSRELFSSDRWVNPNFNIYRIFDVWPVLWDVLGFPGSFDNQQSPLYFNRTDVQDAIHAPYQLETYLSTLLIPPMLSVMPNVIEKSLVMHGFVTLASFVLHALSRSRHSRNMTWHGQQGFQQPIASESFIIEGFGILGAMHQERNLTYVEVDLSGHMMPQYAPWAAYKTLSYLLGREELTDHTNDAALYPSAYALYGLASSKKSLNRHQTEL